MTEFEDRTDPTFCIPESSEEKLIRECKLGLCHDLRKLLLDQEDLPISLRILTQILGIMEQHYGQPPKRYLKSTSKKVSAQEIANLLEVLKREAANLEASCSGSIISMDQKRNST